MPQDKYYGKDVELSDPANEARPIDLSSADASLESNPCRSIYVGTGGTIVMRGTDDLVDRTWVNVPSGSILPFRVALIKRTGTTASNLLALY